jgi:chromate transporter
VSAETQRHPIGMDASPPAVSFREAFRYWVTLGFINFGGPTGQIAIMHRDLVERRRWISEERFLHALNYCMLLPGPEAQQLAIYVGWLLHGTRGGIVAGAFFVLPSIFILLALSWVYAALGTVAWVAALFYGIKPAVVAVVGEAVIRIGRRALTTRFLVAVAAAAFAAIAVLHVPFPLIIAGAALLGLAVQRARPDLIAVPGTAPGTAAARPATAVSDDAPARAGSHPTLRRSLTVVAVCVSLWFAPVLALALWRGPDSVLVQEAIFFSKAAMVTFGGAYAVLAYITQQAVHHYGWIAPGQMLDGLGLAESTPGPLIMVTQFVGFLGAWHHPEGLPRLLAATLGALVTTWSTFVPCFLWIFLGAPYIERLRGNRRLGAALSAITAAVVGVVLNLAVFFARHTLVPPVLGVDLFAFALAATAFVGLQRYHWNMIAVLGASAAAGWGWKTLL